ncbi:MAG: hypothetical protein ABIP11_09405 [Luteimonas sp.]
MSVRIVVLLVLALTACRREAAPPSAISPASNHTVAVATPTVDPDPVLHSASLAGVAEDADATPANLSDASTYRLPGLFAPSTTVSWLQQRFGKANVHVADVPGGEGETSRGVILFPDDNHRRAYLYFQDEKRLRGLSMVRVMDEGSRWQLDNGVAIGMPLSKLQALNGRPIRFTGFDWDYGGAISDWNGGRLQPDDKAPQRRGIGLNHRDGVDGAYPMGEDTFSSDDRRYPHLGAVVIVGEISISFPGEDDL